MATAARSGRARPWPMQALLLAGALGLLAAAVFARIMQAPVGRDENMFFTIPMLLGHGDIYRDFGFNHLPNLAYLLGPLMQASSEPFLLGRALLFVAWVATAALVWAHAWRATRSPAVCALGVLLLATSPLLINQTGTLVSNNFLPIPFALGGALLMFTALDRSPVSSLRIGLAGVLLAFSAGLKANYVFVILPFALASFLVPVALSFGERLRRVVLPLLLGGLVGSVPTLFYLGRDPQGFLAHVIRYHRGPHVEFAARSLDPALVRSPAERLQLAIELWGSGGTVLTAFTVLILLLVLLRRNWRPNWKILTAAALVILGILVAFVPVPSFPQYFSPPVAFLILLLLLLIGELDAAERLSAQPMLLGLALMAVAVDGPRLARDLPGLLRPEAWTGARVSQISAQVVQAASGRPVATLVPVYALDGGARIYAELAAGPFVYRVADLIPAQDRAYYRLASADTLADLLDRESPGAVLIENSTGIEASLHSWAMARGYREIPLPHAKTKSGRLRLYVPASVAGTSDSMSTPPPSLLATTSAPLSETR